MVTTPHRETAAQARGPAARTVVSRDPRLGLALFYAGHFGHLGIVLPFLPPWLHHVGLGSAAIGGLLALGPLSKILAPWTWGALADRTGLRRPLLVATSLCAGAALSVVGNWTHLAPLIVLVGLRRIG